MPISRDRVRSAWSRSTEAGVVPVACMSTLICTAWVVDGANCTKARVPLTGSLDLAEASTVPVTVSITEMVTVAEPSPTFGWTMAAYSAAAFGMAIGSERMVLVVPGAIFGTVSIDVPQNPTRAGARKAPGALETSQLGMFVALDPFSN